MRFVMTQPTCYSGNQRVGDVLEEHAARIDLVVCVHTHFLMREQTPAGVPIMLNFGGD